MEFIYLLFFTIVSGLVLYFLLSRNLEKKIRSSRVFERIRKELEELLFEINQTTDRNITVMEDRIDKMKKLIDRAEALSDKVERVRPVREKAPELETVRLDIKRAVTVTDPLFAQEELPEETTDVRQSIVMMHFQGMDSRLIARKTGKTVGEVDLIISMEKKSK
jgi:hypothetical protein